MIGLPVESPGIYPGPSKARLLYENQQGYIFRQQLILATQSSIALQLRRERGASYPFGASFQLWFTDVNGVAADPGVFEMDIQTSDLDIDAMFVTSNQITSGLNAAFSTRVELPIFWAKYVRANLVSIANPVYSNLLVTR